MGLRAVGWDIVRVYQQRKQSWSGLAGVVFIYVRTYAHYALLHAQFECSCPSLVLWSCSLLYVLSIRV